MFQHLLTIIFLNFHYQKTATSLTLLFVFILLLEMKKQRLCARLYEYSLPSIHIIFITLYTLRLNQHDAAAQNATYKSVMVLNLYGLDISIDYHLHSTTWVPKWNHLSSSFFHIQYSQGVMSFKFNTGLGFRIAPHKYALNKFCIQL